MTTPDVPSVGDLVALLSDPDRAVPAGDFPFDATEADNAGLYSWWADDQALEALSEPFGVRLPPLIYAGQAGATSTRSGTVRAATLRSRVGGNHLNGNVGSSTFRKTLTAVLMEPLGLELQAPGRLDAPSNARISAWMRGHLRIAIAAYPDRSGLAVVEHDVLAFLDPPLNLMGMAHTPIRRRLSQLRSALSAGAARRAERTAPPPAAPQPEVASTMTLHEAMVDALRGQEWTTFDDLAHRIAELGLYRRRDGGTASAGQLRLRATPSSGRYSDLFDVDGAQVRLAICRGIAATRTGASPIAAAEER